MIDKFVEKFFAISTMKGFLLKLGWRRTAKLQSFLSTSHSTHTKHWRDERATHGQRKGASEFLNHSIKIEEVEEEEEVISQFHPKREKSFHIYIQTLRHTLIQLASLIYTSLLNTFFTSWLDNIDVGRRFHLSSGFSFLFAKHLGNENRSNERKEPAHILNV